MLKIAAISAKGMGGLMVLLFFLAGVVPFVYYFVRLPSEAEVTGAKSVRELFAYFGVTSSENIPRASQLPPEAFFCSVCYPHERDSGACRSRIIFCIATNIDGSEPTLIMIFFHLKGFIIVNALQW